MSAPAERLTVLITCGGRWVGMVHQVRRALQAHGGGRLLVADRAPLTPAGLFADASFQVPPIAAPEYVDALLALCEREQVDVLLPLIDMDLERLVRAHEQFRRLGTHLVAPEPDVFELTFDKERFAAFAREEDLPHAPLIARDELETAAYPLFRKHRRGFGSIGVGRCDTPREALAALAADPQLVFQPLVAAEEFSVDAYVNAAGACTLRVVRDRERVVGGEAQVSTTHSALGIHALAARTIEALAHRGLRGPLNLQVFATYPPQLIEVNPRLGSASVLSNMASGGRLLGSILLESRGEVAQGDPQDYQVGLRLHRFTGDVFHQDERVQGVFPAPGPGGLA